MTSDGLLQHSGLLQLITTTYGRLLRHSTEYNTNILVTQTDYYNRSLQYTTYYCDNK